MSENIEKLEKLVKLAVVFKEAVDSKIEGDAELTAQAIASLKPGEMEKLEKLAMRLAGAGMSAVFGDGGAEGFLKFNLGAVEVTVDLASRVMSDDDLAACLPKAMKFREIADELHTEGAVLTAKVVEHALKPA